MIPIILLLLLVSVPDSIVKWSVDSNKMFLIPPETDSPENHGNVYSPDPDQRPLIDFSSASGETLLLKPTAPSQQSVFI